MGDAHGLPDCVSPGADAGGEVTSAEMARQRQRMCSVGKRATTSASRQLCRSNLILEQPLPPLSFTALVCFRRAGVLVDRGVLKRKLADGPWNPPPEGKLCWSPMLRRVCKDLGGAPKGLLRDSTRSCFRRSCGVARLSPSHTKPTVPSFKSLGRVFKLWLSNQWCFALC